MSKEFGVYNIYDVLRGSYNAIWCIPYVWKWRSSSKFKIISYFGTLTMRLEKRDQPHILSNYFCMHNLNCQNIYDRMKTFRSSIILLRTFRFNLCASQKWFILGIILYSSDSNYWIVLLYVVQLFWYFFITFFSGKTACFNQMAPIQSIQPQNSGRTQRTVL